METLVQQNSTQTKSGIQKRSLAVTLDNVSDHAYKKDKATGIPLKSAQLRQTIETIYPSQKGNNSFTNSFVTESDFGFSEGQTFSNDRIAWITLPSNWTEEMVTAALAANPKGNIYRLLSTNIIDVLTPDQISSVESGLQTIEFYKNSKQVVNPATGEIILDPTTKTPLYRQTFYDKDGIKADVDFRNKATDLF